MCICHVQLLNEPTHQKLDKTIFWTLSKSDDIKTDHIRQSYLISWSLWRFCELQANAFDVAWKKEQMRAHTILIRYLKRQCARFTPLLSQLSRPFWWKHFCVDLKPSQIHFAKTEDAPSRDARLVSLSLFFLNIPLPELLYSFAPHLDVL